MAYKPTAKDFEEFDSRLSNDKPTFLNKYVDPVTGEIIKLTENNPVFKGLESARVPEMVAGAAQGAIRGGESIANVPLGLLSKLIGKNVELPYLDLQKMAPGLRNDPYSDLAFKGSEMLGQFLPAGAVAKGIGKVVEPLLGSTLAGSAVTSGATGAALGGSEDDRSRIGAGLVGGTIGATTPLLANKIAETVLNKKKALSDMFKGRYSSIFNKLEKEGLHEEKLTVPPEIKKKAIEEPEEEKGFDWTKMHSPIEYDWLKMESPKATESYDIDELFKGKPDYKKSYYEYIKNPTFENSHNLQSELRKLHGEVNSKIETLEESKTKDVPRAVYNRKEEINEVRNKVKASMYNFLNQNSPEILNEYNGVSKDYATQMAPYLRSAIYRLQNKKIDSRDFVKEILADQEFMAPIGKYKEIPGLGTRKFLKQTPAGNILQKMLTGAAVGAGGIGAGMAANALGIPVPGIGNY